MIIRDSFITYVKIIIEFFISHRIKLWGLGTNNSTLCNQYGHEIELNLTICQLKQELLFLFISTSQFLIDQ